MQWSPSTLGELISPPFSHVIDVRSPSEYAHDHIPGAINLPVLNDAERAKVGTIYVQESRFLARKVGAAMVARNTASHLEGPLAGFDGTFHPAIYCWRGGLRSNSFASMLTQIGWRVAVLDGGYRTYRRLIVQAVQEQPPPAPLLVLDGNTGTAKTDILKILRTKGAQTIDLEALANHRGSVFGKQPGGQPSQKAFEGALAKAYATLDPTRPVWVEAESSRIGSLYLPPPLWGALSKAPRIIVDAPLEARVQYLSVAYKSILDNTSEMVETLRSLVSLQGHERVSAWITLIESGQTRPLLEGLLSHHYDPRYAKSRTKRASTFCQQLPLKALGPEDQNQAAERLLELEQDLLGAGSASDLSVTDLRSR